MATQILTRRSALALFGLWLVCSMTALAVAILLHVAGDRLVVASKLEEIGVWGIYVGVAMGKIGEILLIGPITAQYGGLPEWADLGLVFTAVAFWGLLGVVAIRRFTKARGR